MVVAAMVVSLLIAGIWRCPVSGLSPGTGLLKDIDLNFTKPIDKRR